MNLIRYIIGSVTISLLILSCGNGDNSGDIAEYYSGTIPLPEHPRPDFERDVWINLNGLWEFEPDSLDAGEVNGWMYNDSLFTHTIRVPFSWASPMSGFARRNIHVGWYARNLMIPRGGEWDGKRIYLVIGACDYTTTVWLNGELVGEHEGGYTPFEFDLTDYITGEYETERLIIRAEDMPVPDRLVGKQVYGPAKGIWQTVYLEGRSEHHVKQVHFTPDIDDSTVTVETVLNKPCDEDLIVSIAFKDGIVETAVETFPAGADTLRFDIPIPDLHLWSPDNPFLYEVDIALDSAEEILDHFYTYFGMRKIGTVELPDSDDWYITLNNRPIYLRMALDQAYDPAGYYTFTSDSDMVREILNAKKIGLNGLRIHIKTEIPRKLFWADKLGLLIMADIPNIDGEPDDDARRNWEYTAWNQINRDFNHPSIFSWVLFNETWGLETVNVNGIGIYLPKTRAWVESLYYKAKELDPTRLVEDNSPCNEDHIVSDINSWHAYLPGRQWKPYLDHVIANTDSASNWNYVDGYVQGNVPMMNSECGNVWGYVYGTGDVDISYEYHQMMNEFRCRQKMCGFIFTEFHDVINEWNGYYRYDRTGKKWGLGDLCPGMTVNDFHSDIYVIPGSDFETVTPPDSMMTIPVTVSCMTPEVPVTMTVRMMVHGWNTYGEHFKYGESTFDIHPRPFRVFDAPPIRMNAPPHDCIALLCTYLLDSDGEVVHRNFMPFRVEGGDIETAVTISDTLTVASVGTTEVTVSGSVTAEDSDTSVTAAPEMPETKVVEYTARLAARGDSLIAVRISPDNFTASEWSIKQKSVMDGKKYWGTGGGYIEYTFPWPEGVNAEDVESVRFLAELSSRRVQGKDMIEGEYVRQSIANVSSKGIDPGHSPNSYPMTDEYPWPGRVAVSLNGGTPQVLELPDDPADHRGLLSWLSQEPGSIVWTPETPRLNWRLDEAGSYGYMADVTFDGAELESAITAGRLHVRLAVEQPASDDKPGGLAVYGREFGRFPFDPTVLIKRK